MAILHHIEPSLFWLPGPNGDQEVKIARIERDFSSYKLIGQLTRTMTELHEVRAMSLMARGFFEPENTSMHKSLTDPAQIRQEAQFIAESRGEGTLQYTVATSNKGRRAEALIIGFGQVAITRKGDAVELGDIHSLAVDPESDEIFSDGLRVGILDSLLQAAPKGFGTRLHLDRPLAHPGLEPETLEVLERLGYDEGAVDDTARIGNLTVARWTFDGPEARDVRQELHGMYQYLGRQSTLRSL